MIFQRKFETQVRKKEASCQTASEDCYSIRGKAGTVPPHFDIKYDKVVYICFDVLGIKCRPSYIRINEYFLYPKKGDALCDNVLFCLLIFTGL